MKLLNLTPIKLLVIIYIALFSTKVFSAWHNNAEWDDQFYQYRIPFEVNATSTGRVIINISPDTIIDAINQLEVTEYSSKYFDFNQIKIIKYDSAGNLIGAVNDAGFYWSYISDEMVTNNSFEASDSALTGWKAFLPQNFMVATGAGRDGSNCLRIWSDKSDRNRMKQGEIHFNANTFYMLSFWSKAIQNTYNANPNISDMLDSWHSLESSYMPVLFSKYWTQYFAIYNEEIAKDVQINIERGLTGEAFLDDISIREISIKLLINATAGSGKYMLYYQPSQMRKRFVPTKSIQDLPTQSLTPTLIASAQRYDSITQYKIESTAECDIWFAETTRKVTPQMPAPLISKSVINISAAKNERQSFQLVYKAHDNVTLTNISLGTLTFGTNTIPAGKSYTKILEYINMASKSPSAASLVPRIGDPLIPFETRTLDANSENLISWFTVIVDSNTASGNYTGKITIHGNRNGTTFIREIPITLKVHEFTLPKQSTFKTAHGGQHFVVKYSGGHNIYDFHGVNSTIDKQTLVRAYLDTMCQNKVFPGSLAYGHGWSYSWDPPPQGYNVDTTNNYFNLHNWDFEDYNTEMQYYVDTYHINSFQIAHVNGDIINKFSLTGYFKVGWDYPDASVTAITQKQYDTLLTNYYAKVAENLQLNGWLDYAYISIDESSVASYPKIRHFCDVLATHPLTRLIKIQWDIDKSAAYTWKENPDTDIDIAMKNRIDIWTPENNERGSFWHNYFWTEHNMDPAKEEIWCYYTKSAHLNIDAHGLSNRILPVKNFFMNSNGYLNWASFIYEIPDRGVQNPWIDPYSPWGNGAVSYFYPPSTNMPASPDFTITPSCRLETFREGIDDYEYMVLLDHWIKIAAAHKINVSDAVVLKNKMNNIVPHPVRWSTNDEYYLLLREQIANKIDTLINSVLCTK